jgi:uncharacterized iron-regulated membrane protein
MGDGFRASMDWLHTWAGVVLGGLLFAVFWMGTLSVFDQEIDRWMAPATRLGLPAQPASLDSLRPSFEAAVAARSPTWGILFATERVPVLRVSWRDAASGYVQRLMHPATGAPLVDDGTLGGSRFIYPFHYMLHVGFADIGFWIVGLLGMAMLALCVSGVVIHRKILGDFFTFRASAKPRRQVLDLHNLMGVLGLPFHVAISLSGLVIFFTLYFPMVPWTAYGGDRPAFLAETYGLMRRPVDGHPGAMAPLDGMVAQARALWDGAPVMYLVVRNPGDRRSIVQIGRLDDTIVSSPHDVAYFDATSGRMIGHRMGSPPVLSTQRFLAGLHLVQFRHWTLRWGYFALGLSGCVVIATGYLFWLESRRRKRPRLGLNGVRVVEGLTIGSTAGIVIATLSFFVINRLLPLGVTFAGYERAALEVWTFYLVWPATFAHAWLRPHRAWLEQCWAMTAFAGAAVVLNWFTTGDHLWRSIAHRHLWSVAGMDLLLLAGAVVAALTARKLQAELVAHPGNHRVRHSRR